MAEEAGARGMAALQEELARETPYRARFFRLIASRILGRGRPVVFVPIIHHTDGGGGVALGNPWAWRSLDRGAISARTGGRDRASAGTGRAENIRARDGAGRDWQGSAAGFGTLFSAANFR